MKNKFAIKSISYQSQKGAVLLEALIAILIFSFGILAISGLQGAMMKNTAEATYRAEASYVVQQQLGVMLSTPYGLGGNNTMPVANLPSGILTTKLLSDGRFKFLVTWQVPGESQHSYEAVTSIFTAR
ncbi:MAG: prepilin-type cleavage/methylation domain-containing protein [Pseudomonadota bacterium]